MKERRQSKIISDFPALATGDIAFNLIVFFLVCISVQPDNGREQELPRGEETKQEQEAENLEVALSRLTERITIAGDNVATQDAPARFRRLLAGKPRPEDRVVVVKSEQDTPYHHWITVTSMIESEGGIITIQTEEEQQVTVP